MLEKLTKVRDIFDIAIRLMDEQNESTGATDTADTKEYQVRTPSILNSLLDRVYPASDTWPQAENGRRPICPKVSAMTDELDLDERICTGVLPYGLAALLLSEDSARADFFWQTFLEQLDAAKQGIPSGIEQIEDVYGTMCGFGGGIEYGQFSHW